eukprot:COSAG04_NODE_291_length_17813_cov_32.336231_13_plen_59_part_00
MAGETGLEEFPYLEEEELLWRQFKSTTVLKEGEAEEEGEEEGEEEEEGGEGEEGGAEP